MFNNPHVIGPCPTIIQIVGRPVTGSLPRTIAPPPNKVLTLYFYEIWLKN